VQAPREYLKLKAIFAHTEIPLTEIPTGKLKVMLIDEARERSESIAEILQSVDCEVVANVNPEHDLLEQVERYAPDIVIIDIDLPDRDMLENLRSVQSSTPRPMVMFSQDDDGYTIRRAVEAGVSAYVVDGVKASRVRPVLDAAIATFDRYQLLQKQLDVTRLELDKRNKIERAKGILMKQRGIDDKQAYEFMRKAAMDHRLKVIDVAQRIIDAAELLGGPV
jgi:two-component system, response regulator / RNA-binding antiterminator